MKKRFSILVLIVAIIVSALVASLISFGAAYRFVREEHSYESGINDMDMLNAVDYAYRNYYYGEIEDEALEEGLIAGYIYGTGDNYGEYMDAQRVEEFTNDTNGKNVGIGVSVIYNDEYSAIEIVNVVSESPAEKAGIMVGDIIIEVGGVDATQLSYSETIEAMTGEEGTTAEFTVLRNEERLSFSIVRRAVTQENAKGHLHSDSITGIIRIEEFDTTTPAQFKSEVERLQSQGATRFVFDVRNNPGGELDSIVEILDYLLPQGPIIRIESKDGTQTLRESDAECVNFPMAVLINENTASAAELFAAALKDYDVATLVGVTSYGKGSVQSILPLIDGSALRLTVSMYKPPFSDNYDGVGVTPNLQCEMAEDVKDISLYKLTDEQDTQLVRAIEYLNNNK